MTWKARRKWKRKQKRKNVLLDWLEAFIWAACVVLLINQYLFQAYAIPSSSMESTLLVGDHVFVNKFIFGPELYPGGLKLPGLTKPARGDVIIFESPDYPSQGPIFDIAQRLIYMLTLSLIDIDRDSRGQPKAHFLVKRGIGVSGDTVRFREGIAYYLPKGEKNWINDEQLKTLTGLDYTLQRDIKEANHIEYYSYYPTLGRISAWNTLHIPTSQTDQKTLSSFDSFSKKLQLLNDRQISKDSLRFDTIELERQELIAYLQVMPHDNEKRARLAKLQNGIYIPNGWVLPLGDNRDNSRDGRFFGLIPQQKLLGKADFRYWPLHRTGKIR